MRRVGTVLALGLVPLALGLAGQAAATTLVAGPVTVGNGDTIFCSIVNLGSKDLTDVLIEAIADNVETEGPLTIAPGASDHASNSVSVGSLRVSWCRFTFNGSKKSARASACATTTGFSCISALEAR